VKSLAAVNHETLIELAKIVIITVRSGLWESKANDMDKRKKA
jgi:hypothetical protein